MTKFTAEHFPVGTIVETQLFSVQNGELVYAHLVKDPAPAQFTVREVLIADTLFGRNILLVTNTLSPFAAVTGETFIKINIDHVDRIVKVGKKKLKMVFDASWSRQGSNMQDGLTHWIDVLFYVRKTVARLQPEAIFDLESMIQKLKEVSIVVEKMTRVYDEVELPVYVINKKRLKAWMKQNVNRYLKPKKQIEKEEQQMNEQMYPEYQPGDEVFEDLPDMV